MLTRLNDNLHDIIECCYGAIDNPALLGTATEMIGKAINADAGDIVTEFASDGFTRTYGSFGFDPVFLDIYDSNYLGDNPWLDNLMQFQKMTVHSDEQFSSHYHESRYYNEWVRPQGLGNTVGGVIEGTPDKHTWVGFVREIGCTYFGEVECSFLDKIMPHLRRSLNVINSLNEAVSKQSSMRAMCDTLNVPVFLLDACGRLTFKNEMGHDLLTQHSGIFLAPSGRLSLRNCQTDDALAASIKGAANVMTNVGKTSPNTIPVEISAGKFIALTVVPLMAGLQVSGSDARVAVFASGADIAKDIDITPVSNLYNLTETESKLALSIGMGKDLASFAQEHGASIATARWHLKNLEHKTETNRLDELASLIQSALAPIRTT